MARSGVYTVSFHSPARSRSPPCLLYRRLPQGFPDRWTDAPLGSAGRPVPGWDLRVLRPEVLVERQLATTPAKAAAGASDGANDGGGDGVGASTEFFATRADAALHGPPGTPHHHLRHLGEPAPSPSGEAAALQSPLPPGHHGRLHPAPYAPEADTNELGPLAIRLPMPPGSMATLWGDEAR
jgi:hypothetical protein